LYFKLPCVTIRESTERPETIEAGSNILSGLNPENVLKAVNIITKHERNWEWSSTLGDGKTSMRVVNILGGKITPLGKI